jgi:hypothetical protein
MLYSVRGSTTKGTTDWRKLSIRKDSANSQERKEIKANRNAKSIKVGRALRSALKVLIANTFRLHHHRSNNGEVGWPAILAFWTLGHHWAIKASWNIWPLATLLPGFLSNVIEFEGSIFWSAMASKESRTAYQAAPIENYIPLSAMRHANPLPLSLPKNRVLDPPSRTQPTGHKCRNIMASTSRWSWLSSLQLEPSSPHFGSNAYNNKLKATPIFQRPNLLRSLFNAHTSSTIKFPRGWIVFKLVESLSSLQVVYWRRKTSKKTRPKIYPRDLEFLDLTING